MPLIRDAACQRGFTMLEVLVALLILMIGLLGLAGLLVTTQQGEVEAYQRKQAAVLLQDMIDRITANPKAAGSTCYAFTINANGTPFLGTGNAVDAAFLCSGGSVSQNQRGVVDLAAWNNALLGASEKKGSGALTLTNAVGAIIDARGCVTNPSTGVYVVSVAWRGLQPTVAPPAAYTCAKDQYTAAGGAVDERLRRVISVTIRIANLAA